jgi:hypothetical protein
LKKYLEEKPNVKIFDFEIPYMGEDTEIGEVAWTFNSSLGVYLLAFLINDKNGTPYIHEYKFKIESLEYMHDSMISNIYTIKGISDGEVYYRYNDVLEPTEIAMLPNNTEIETKIFTEYED